MATQAQVISWLISESGQLPTLQTDFAAIGSAVGTANKISAVQVLTDEVFTLVETFPFDAQVAPVASAELKAKAVKWAGLLAFLEGILPVILPLIHPTPAAS